MLLDGNIFERSWVHAQIDFAIVLTPAGSVVEDVTFTKNIVRHVEQGVNIMSQEPNSTTRAASRILLRNNLFCGVNGLLFQILRASTDLVIEHNTAVSGRAAVVGEGAATRNLVLRNNLLPYGEYEIIGTGTAPKTPTIARYFPDSTITANFGAQIGAVASGYPPVNRFTPLDRMGPSRRRG